MEKKRNEPYDTIRSNVTDLIYLITAREELYKDTGDEIYKNQRDVFVRDLDDLLQGGKFDFRIKVHKDDAIAGGFSGPGPFDSFADKYGKVDVFVKKMPISAARQLKFDTELAYENHEGEFNLPKIWPRLFEIDDYAYVISVMVPGPDMERIYSVLNTMFEGGDTKAVVIKEHLLDKSLDDLLVWQADFGDNIPPDVLSSTEFSRLKDPSTIKQKYIMGSSDAILNSVGKTYNKRINQSSEYRNFNVPEIEEELIKLSLGIFDDLTLEGSRVARILDPTLANQGINLGKDHFEDDQDFYKTLLDTLTAKPHNGMVKIDYAEIQRRFFHWDPKPLQYGHFTEDVWKLLDSPAIDIDPEEIDSRWYPGFLFAKFPGHAKDHTIEFDDFLVRYFRNLRHRDLVISSYVPSNETMYQDGHRSIEERDKKRLDYAMKAEHYTSRAIHTLTYLISHLESNGIENPLAAMRSATLQKNLDSIEAGEYSEAINKQDTENIKILKDLMVTLEGDYNRPDRQIVQLHSLLYLTKKLSRYSEIHYDKAA